LPMSFSLFSPPPPAHFLLITQRDSYKNIVKWKNHLIVMFCSSKLNKNHPWGNISYQSQRATSNNEEKNVSHNEKTS
jgi:hypothetical protein